MHVYRATRALSALALAIGLALIAVPVMAAAPSPAWTKQFGSGSDDFGMDVAVAGSGHAYVVGYTFGSVTGWPSHGAIDAFVRKYKPDGKKAWTKQFGTSSSDEARGVAVDQAGNAYVVGCTGGILSGNRDGNGDAFVRKYRPNGRKAWTKQFGTNMWDCANDIAIDRKGSIYVAGYAGTGGGDAFVRKLKPNGNKVWHRRFGTDGEDVAAGVAVDWSGNVYVAGEVAGSLAGTSNGGLDAFVREYKPNGSKVWTKQFGTIEDDAAYDVVVNRYGRVAVAGATRGTLSGRSYGFWDAFVRAYKSDGTKVWTKQFGTAGSDIAYAIAADRFGRFAITGETTGALAGPSSGSADVFVRVLKSNSDHKWTSQFGSASLDTAYGVAVDTEPQVLVAGRTWGSITGWPSLGVPDAFVRKYKR